MDHYEADELLPLIEAYHNLYEWQLEFIAAAHTAKQRMLMAGNRVGKTTVAGVEAAFHLLGNYPADWPGVKFERAPTCWAMGVSGEQIRDVVQLLMCGTHDGTRFSGGLIPPAAIYEVVMATGTARLAKDVRIFHKYGYSTLSLKSYSQGQSVLMGSSVDYAWIDEEPYDQSIYPQVLIRTATGNKKKGGWLTITETPELGATELVLQYTEQLQKGQYFRNITWDDAPHLTAEVRSQLLGAIPAYQREMREKGIPVLGEGRIYTIAEERIKVDPFPIPDHWFQCAAIDFGFDHPTAIVWCAHDRDTDVIYIIDAYAESGEIPTVHARAIKSRGRYPLIYPRDGDNTEKGSGEALTETYREEGIEFAGEFTNPDGSVFVEPGIMELLNRMRTGRLKVFSHLAKWFAEFRLYHRKAGKIVKVRDDIMDATRYAAVSVPRYGIQRVPPEHDYIPGISRRVRSTGRRAYNS